jgi:hypothetical protein
MTLLEARRIAVDASLWQTPGLLIAAQAFLLIVIADRRVGWWPAAGATAAGLTISVVAWISLRRQVRVEHVLSAEVSNHAIALYAQDPRWQFLRASDTPESKVPASTEQPVVANQRLGLAAVLFSLVLAVLALADALAFVFERV